jgi:N,N'-diacetyllegionaminate synthase
MKTVIIAEAGVNHNGDLTLAKELIDIAADSGADYVKFQTFSAEELTTKAAPKAEYQKHFGNYKESQYEMLRKLELTESMCSELIKHSNSRGIGFLSTAFDMKSADMLLALGQRLFKIPSGEITNLPYLRHIAHFGKNVILSTGMSNMAEVGKALKILEESGTAKSKVTVLHCTSSYPAPISDINLLAMNSIRKTLDVAVGYSDHTLGIEVAVAAVALGASVIEKHFTIDRSMPGPDHRASLEPKELQLMVSQIRNIELALGDGIKRITLSERENIKIARKSIVAKRNITRGEVFNDSNLATKRPGTGISPMEWDRLIGNRASRDFVTDELIDET